jgi:predicted methyltransferase
MYGQPKLSELIRFACVDAGSTVIDVYPGDGDWMRLFSGVVEPEERVYSFVPAEERFGRPHAGACEEAGPRERRSRLRGPRRDVGGDATSGCPVAAPVLPRSSYRTDPCRGATAADFNRAVYERLKPGGFYVIVDHAAAAGAGTSDAQPLHPIEPASVREEVEAAGFVLDADSTILANKDDPHSTKVFDPSNKGEPIASYIGS